MFLLEDTDVLFARVLLPLYLLGTFLMVLATVTDFVLVGTAGDLTPQRQVTVGQRLISVLLWPALMWPARGRRYMRRAFAKLF